MRPQWAAGSGWRSYENPIGARIMYSEFSDRMRHDLLNSQAVRFRIRNLAERRLNELPATNTHERQKARLKLENQLHDVAEGLAKELVARMDSLCAPAHRSTDVSLTRCSRFLRFFGATINQLLVRMYDGINASVDEIARVRAFPTC
jgi:hypothetical protein